MFLFELLRYSKKGMKLCLSSHLDLYTAVSTVAFCISGGLVTFFPLFATPPDEWAESKHIQLNFSQASFLKTNVIRV